MANDYLEGAEFTTLPKQFIPAFKKEQVKILKSYKIGIIKSIKLFFFKRKINKKFNQIFANAINDYEQEINAD